MGDLDKSIADYTEAIRIEPKYANAYQGRGYTNFEMGNFAEAASDLLHLFDLRTAPAPYPTLWRFLALRRTGEDGVAELSDSMAKLKTTKWPYPVMEFFVGKRTMADMKSAASNTDEKCETEFYSGEWYLLGGDKAEAKKAFEAALQICPKSFIEYSGARAELNRLKP